MPIRRVLMILGGAYLLAACGGPAPTATPGPTAPGATATAAASAVPASATTAPAAPATTTAAPRATVTAAWPEPTATGAAPASTATAPAAARTSTPGAAPATPAAAATAPPATPSALAATPPSPTAAVETAIPDSLSPQTLQVPDSLRQGTFAVDHSLNLPSGFAISLFAAGLNSPRIILTGPDGNLWVTERGAGRVQVYAPQGEAATPPQPQTFASGLNAPHGLAFHDGYLYVAETTDVVRFPVKGTQAGGPAEKIIPNIPYQGDHSTRTLLFLPDGRLLLSIGSSCNVCREADPHFAAVWVYNADGSNGRVYASGLRNAVGLALAPGTQQPWFTVNGRDNLGDNVPPDMIGRLVDGAFYGFPDCYGQQQVDAQFGGDPAKCKQMQVPELLVQAHSAPLGLTFVPPQGWPAPYGGDVIVAYHGSFNRSVPTGYKLVRVPMANGEPSGPVTDFVTGWLQSNVQAWGRPVAPVVGTDGALYVTDDHAGAIYRIYRTGQ